MRTITLAYLTMLIPLFLFAQEAPEIEFGRIAKADREMMVCPTDSQAEAYTLFNQLILEVVQNKDGAPRLLEHRHRRVKLLSAASFDRASVELIFRRDYEKINNLRAAIHLPRGGMIALKRSDFVLERYDDERDIYRFSFPKVTEGAIIEYAFSKYNDDPNEPTPHIFREEIPVRWSDYRALIPTYFNYVDLARRDAKFDVNFYERVSAPYGGEDVEHLNIHLGIADLPAFSPEKYANNFKEYLPQIHLRLQSVQYPGRPLYELFDDWESLMTELDGSGNFGKAYRNRSNFNRAWKALNPDLVGLFSDEEKIQVIYQFVADRVSWNGEYTYGTGKSLNRVFDRGEGSSGEMNLLLLGLLQQAGIRARPVLVPLRNRGIPLEATAILDQFDHTMVLVEFSGGGALLDVDKGLRPAGLPRISALNHRALVADAKEPFWIDVQVPKSTQTIIADLTVDADGIATGKVKSQLKRYFAVELRSQMADQPPEGYQQLARNLLGASPSGGEANSPILEGGETAGSPMMLSFDVKTRMGTSTGDSLVVLPVLIPLLDLGAHDLDNRLSPIDFAYPHQKKYVATVTIPEGYTILQLPESTRMKAEDGSVIAAFTTVKRDDNSFSINYTVDFSQAVYDVGNRASMLELFRRILEIQDENVVLKRDVN
jgi:hypothetical protein